MSPLNHQLAHLIFIVIGFTIAQWIGVPLNSRGFMSKTLWTFAGFLMGLVAMYIGFIMFLGTQYGRL